MISQLFEIFQLFESNYLRLIFGSVQREETEYSLIIYCANSFRVILDTFSVHGMMDQLCTHFPLSYYFNMWCISFEN